jgi:hypothetical protein
MIVVYLLIYVSFSALLLVAAVLGFVGVYLRKFDSFLSYHNLLVLYSIKEFLFAGIQFVSTLDIEESNRVKL